MSGPKNLWIHGSTGRMGTAIQRALDSSHHFKYIGGSGQLFHGKIAQNGTSVSAAALADALRSHKVDCICDFSQVEANLLLLEALKKSKNEAISVLIGTTGLSDQQLYEWKKLAEQNHLKILFAPNTSIGILILSKIAAHLSKITVPMGFDIEIIETHHRKKTDAPSGTAKYLAQKIEESTKNLHQKFLRSGKRENNEIGMHSVRGGGVFGEHEVRMISETEELTLSHRAFSRDLFASGALTLCRWLVSKTNGFFTLDDIDLTELLQ